MAAYLESTTSTSKAHIFYNNSTEIASITGAGVLQLIQGGTTVTLSPATGWAATIAGTATRTTFDTTSITLPQLAERVKALLDDLRTKGIISA